MVGLQFDGEGHAQLRLEGVDGWQGTTGQNHTSTDWQVRESLETKTVKMELRLNLILVANEFRIYKLDLKTFYYKATINVSS